MAIEHRYYAVNHISLHVAVSGKAEKGIIVFLHGFPEYSYAWHQQLEFFAANGFMAIAPDQRGYNLSSKPKGGVKQYLLKHLVADIIELIGQLTTEKIFLVGHDWGGGVAWTLAQQHPELLHKLIILNMPHLQVMKQNLKRNPKQMLKSWYAGFFQLPILPEMLSRAFNFKMLARSLTKTSHPGTFNMEDMVYYKTAWRKPYALTGMINWYRAYRHNNLNTDVDISTPTLLIWGKKDATLGHEMAPESIKRCKDGRLVMLNDATHWLHHEEPEVINRLILDFVIDL